jgi:hypothetical protein
MFGDVQRREDHWAVVDLFGKGGHVSTVPVHDWVKGAVDRWKESVPIISGMLRESPRA